MVLMVVFMLLLEVVELRGLNLCLAHVCYGDSVGNAVELDDALTSAHYLQLLAVNIRSEFSMPDEFCRIAVAVVAPLI